MFDLETIKPGDEVSIIYRQTNKCESFEFTDIVISIIDKNFVKVLYMIKSKLYLDNRQSDFLIKQPVLYRNDEDTSNYCLETIKINDNVIFKNGEYLCKNNKNLCIKGYK